MYVGSFGAVVWLYGRGWISESSAEWLGVVFIPLGWFVEQSPALEPAFDAYIEWLGPCP